MVSDWVKTQKKPPRTNQSLAALTTKFSEENGHGFLQTTIWFCTQNNNRKVFLNKFQKPEHGQKYVFLAKCIENAVLREKYCQQKRGKWARETSSSCFLWHYSSCGIAPNSPSARLFTHLVINLKHASKRKHRSPVNIVKRDQHSLFKGSKFPWL